MSYDAFTNPPNDPASFAASLSWQSATSAGPAGLLQALAQAHKFTLEDLQANREGWMSPRQRKGVVRRTIGYLFGLFIVIGGAVGGAGVPLAVQVGSFWALGLILLGLVVYALLAMTFINRARKQLHEGRVTFVDGFVERESQKSHSEGTTTISYYYVVHQQQPSGVKPQRFTVNRAAFYALVPALRYRVYYVPVDRKLISIEPLA